MSSHRYTVAVALSGGVDSSVTALLLKKEGFDVIGIHMSNWDALETGLPACAHKADLEAARKIAGQLKIPLHTVDFVRQYWTDVFAPMIEAYRMGLTPNPDIMCNRYIKFGHLLDHVREKLGADALATGHYARLDTTAGPQPLLRRGVDPIKDQSYFLASVTGSKLKSVLFPLGGMLKSEVRSLARASNLFTAERPDSTGLCFVGKAPSFSAFLGQYIPTRNGDFVDVDSDRKVGSHKGAELYCPGQSARIAGLGPNHPGWFVCGKNMQQNTVLVCRGHDHHALLSRKCVVADLSWVNDEPPARAGPTLFQARYRHMAGIIPAHIHLVNDDKSALRVLPSNQTNSTYDPQRSCRMIVEFTAPQRGLCTGQFLSVYDGETCLGGGTILSFEPLHNSMERPETNK